MKKTLAAFVLSLMVIASIPLVSRAEPVLIATIVGTVLGVDFLSCDINIIWGCDEGGGGGTGLGGDVPAKDPTPVPTPCTSAPNSCGMTTTGFVKTATVGGKGNSCDATTPPDSACPPPTIGANGFKATPSLIGPGMHATLSWNVANVSACSISSDSAFTYSGTGQGSVDVNPTQTTTYTLSCHKGGGPSGTRSIRVTYDPHFVEK